MKYVMLQGEGVADVPNRDLGGKKPPQTAATPNMDFLARHGEVGLAAGSTEGHPPGGEVTPLAILGYDPKKYHSGPAPFEAAGLGVALGEHDVAFRCSMVTLGVNAPRGRASAREEVKKLGPQVTMEDATAGGVEDDEARELIDAVNEQLGSEAIQFYPGKGPRHLMVWVGGKSRATCYDPQDVVGKSIGEFLPTGDGAEILRQVMEASLVILRDHPVNQQRREAGRKPANCLWLWGQGRALRLPSLTDQYRITGAVLSATDLPRGVGICAGLEAVDPAAVAEAGGPGFLRLAEAALRELGKKDFVYVHAEMPADVRLGDDRKAKLRFIEEFDQKMVGTIREGLPKLGPHRLLLICDHHAAAASQPHVATPARYILFEGPVQPEKAPRRGSKEADAKATQARVRDATRLMSRLLSQGAG